VASLRDIKLRIRSVKSTQKITKAMEMVSAAKMKRAQNQALKGRPYLQKLSQIIADLVFLSDPKLKHPLLKKPKTLHNIGYIFITASRGLCGSYNTNVIRKMLEILAEKNHTKEKVITVGRKGRQAMERIGKAVLADFENMPDKPGLLDTIGISQVVMDDFLAGKLDEVWMVYNHFYSTATQKPIVTKLLPIEPDKTLIQEKMKLGRKSDYIFEPNKELLLDELLRRYAQTMVYQTVLEAAASEHSARMMAMKQASDNAHDIVSHLTLHYNKARQAKITTEILEVVAGSAAT
jgi:F-type H+-transporting ATPase subunit gamma